MIEHPYIDFDGDGHADNYDTAADSDGHYMFLHHDVHGPWNMDRPTLDEYRTYWQNDDALFRSSVSFAGRTYFLYGSKKAVCAAMDR